MIEINHFICLFEQLWAVCRITLRSLMTSDKWARYKRGKLIMKHAKRKSVLICLCIFSLRHCFPLWLSCDASSHFHFWSASLDACYCEWHLCSTSENLSRRMQPMRSVQPQNNVSSWSLLWIQSMIYGSYRLQESSNLNTSYFVCCQDMVETSSSKPEDSVWRSTRLRASIFREVLSQKRAKTPPKFKPLRD